MIAAVYLLLVRDGSVLLSRRRSTGYEDGRLGLVGGHLEDDEPVRVGAAREAREEVGLEIPPEAIDIVTVMHRLAAGSRLDFFTVCTGWTGEPANREPNRCAGLFWHRLDAPPADTIPYVRRAIANYLSGQWFDSYGWDERSDDRPPRLR